VAELGLQLVSSCDLTLASLLVLADNLSVDAQFEDAAVHLDGVLDVLEIDVDILHTLNLSYVGTNTLWVLANSIDLLLEPVLLVLNPILNDPRKFSLEIVKAFLGHRHELFTDLKCVDFDHADVFRLRE
jgi:hypothetical protein